MGMQWICSGDLQPVASLIRMRVVSYASPLNEWDLPIGEGRQEIITEHLPILSYTASGAWIEVYGQRKFVNLRARKERQIVILSAQLHKATRVLKMLDMKGVWHDRNSD